MDLDIEQCKDMINKNANKSVLGKNEEKEATKFLEKVEDVSTLLQELMSKDHDKVKNTSLAAPGALAHRLQRLQNSKWPLGGPKMADGVWRGVQP